jgi:hypothetical protein
MIFTQNRKKKARIDLSFGKIKDDYFNFDLIEKYFRNKDNSNGFQVLSDKTCIDLDFRELFSFVDRTTSKVGQQYLYNKLRVIPNESENLELSEKLISKLSNNKEFRINTQLELEKLNREEVYYIASLFQEEHLKPPKWFFIIRLLSFTSILSLIMIFFNQQFAFILLATFIVNLVIHYRNKKNLYQYLGSIPQLLRLNNIAFKFHKER